MDGFYKQIADITETERYPYLWSSFPKEMAFMRKDCKRYIRYVTALEDAGEQYIPVDGQELWAVNRAMVMLERARGDQDSTIVELERLRRQLAFIFEKINVKRKTGWPFFWRRK